MSDRKHILKPINLLEKKNDCTKLMIELYATTISKFIDIFQTTENNDDQMLDALTNLRALDYDYATKLYCWCTCYQNNINIKYSAYVLGYQHMYGIGVAKDQKEAIKYFTKSAENDNTMAMFSMACIYNYINDKDSAIKWFTKAADKGHVLAGEMLEMF